MVQRVASLWRWQTLTADLQHVRELLARGVRAALQALHERELGVPERSDGPGSSGGLC